MATRANDSFRIAALLTALLAWYEKHKAECEVERNQASGYNLNNYRPKPRALDTADWSEADTRAYREEVERRFKSRTPPQRPDEVLWESRVMRGEMRTWAKQVLGKSPPESDNEWVNQHGVWYTNMAKRHDPAAVKKRKSM